MNSDQFEQVLDFINDFEKSSYEEKVIENLKESQSMIGDYSPEEFIAIIKRILRQFKNELNSSSGRYLPFQYNYNNEFGGGKLLSDLQNLKNHIEAKQYPNTLGYINRLIYYQISNGFWDKSTRKIHKASEIKITEIKDKIGVLEKNIKSILKDFSTEKEEFEKYINAKKEELENIETNLETSNTTVSEITNLLTKSSENTEKIKTILEEQNSKLEEATSNIETEKEYFEESKSLIEEFKTNLEEKIKEFDDKNSSFSEKLEFVENKKEFFEERISYLEELIGREVGASLFETFKQRKNELNFSVNFWKYAVPIMTIAIIVWVYFLFGNGEQFNQSIEGNSSGNIINWEKICC